MKFRENLSSRSLFVTRGRTEGPTDMTKLIVAFRNFTNAHANVSSPKTYFAHKQQFLITHRYTILQQTERT